MYRSLRGLLLKDWTFSKASLAAMLAAIALATLLALPTVNNTICAGSCFMSVGSSQAILQLVCVLLGVIFVATVVQNDSPTDASAFWIAQPVQPHGLLIAKALSVIVLPVAVSLSMQAVWLVSVGLSVADSFFLLLFTAYSVTSVVLFAALVASITRGTQAFLLLLCGLCLLRLLAVPIAMEVVPSMRFVSVFQTGFRADVWLLIAGATLASLFLARKVGRTAKISGTVVVLVVLTMKWDFAAMRGFGPLTRVKGAAGASLPDVQLSLVRAGAEFRLKVQTTAPTANHRYTLVEPQVIVQFDSIPEHDYRNLYGNQAVFTPDTVPGSVNTAPATVSLLLPVDLSNGRVAANDSVVRLYVSALLREEVLDTVLSFPLVGNNERRAGATRFQLTENDEPQTGEHFVLDVLTAGQRPLLGRHAPVADGERRGPWGRQQHSWLPAAAFEYFAVGPGGTNVIRLLPVNGNAVETALPLPAPGVLHNRGALRVQCVEGGAMVCGPDWWKGKRLLVKTWRHASYKPVRATLQTVRQPTKP